MRPTLAERAAEYGASLEGPGQAGGLDGDRTGRDREGHRPGGRARGVGLVESVAYVSKVKVP